MAFWHRAHSDECFFSFLFQDQPLLHCWKSEPGFGVVPKLSWHRKRTTPHISSPWWGQVPIKEKRLREDIFITTSNVIQQPVSCNQTRTSRRNLRRWRWVYCRNIHAHPRENQFRKATPGSGDTGGLSRNILSFFIKWQDRPDAFLIFLISNPKKEKKKIAKWVSIICAHDRKTKPTYVLASRLMKANALK